MSLKQKLRKRRKEKLMKQALKEARLLKKLKKDRIRAEGDAKRAGLIAKEKKRIAKAKMKKNKEKQEKVDKLFKQSKKLSKAIFG